jgi:hypothetical protein
MSNVLKLHKIIITSIAKNEVTDMSSQIRTVAISMYGYEVEKILYIEPYGENCKKSSIKGEIPLDDKFEYKVKVKGARASSEVKLMLKEFILKNYDDDRNTMVLYYEPDIDLLTELHDTVYNENSNIDVVEFLELFDDFTGSNREDYDILKIMEKFQLRTEGLHFKNLVSLGYYLGALAERLNSR